MAWEDIVTKLALYRTLEYGGNEQADKVIVNHYGVTFDPIDDAMSAATVPLNQRDDMEADLDYRIGACENLEESRAWSPDMLRKAMS